jgi:predicted RNA-binding Zn ribbon-like protein
MVSEGDPKKRAPEPLDLVQRFVNSVELDTGEDDLSTRDALRGWLAERELISPDEPVSEGDLRRALDVREGLRSLLMANACGEVDSPAVEALDRAASRAGLRVRLEPAGPPRLEADAGGVDGAIARLLAIVSEAAANGTWERLKACVDDTCRWAFYDHTKNRSGKWCSMDVCGNQHKARTYRERRRKAEPVA